ncbi:MAG: acyltransferase [Pontiellaceae bacterium]|nr:acyltransferase [Pontiellaceae bacterium]MBN2784484.1 acyltransferase [Pontiellaceae bacterium]
MSSIRYRPEIDGLRAVAVIAVILFHINQGILPGGYVGVDVFFVISGFLITSIILHEEDQGAFRFVNFWLRRIRRILPALLAMTLTTLVAGNVILYKGEINNLGLQGLATLLSFANFSQWMVSGNYWGPLAETSPFLHAWSLSVEEQFYLIFPLFIYLSLRFFRKWVAWVLLLVVLGSALLFLVGIRTHPAATFYLLPFRAWELGIGALLAVIRFRAKQPLPTYRLLSAAGLVAVLICCIFPGGRDGLSSLLLIPVLGTVLVIAFAGGTTDMVTRLLSAAPVVYIGRISYSLYLWHWPLLVYSRQLAQKNGEAIHPALLLTAIFAVSILSYRFIEIPTRRNNRMVPVTLLLLLVGSGYSYYLKRGTYSEDTAAYNQTVWYGNRYRVDPHFIWPESVQKRMTGITVLFNEDGFAEDAYAQEGILKIYGPPNPDIVVLGDSHSEMWAKVLDEIAQEDSRSISFFCADGTSAFFPIPPENTGEGSLFFTAEEKQAFDQARLRCLETWRPSLVIIVDRWENIGSQKETEDLLRYIGGLGSQVLCIEQPPELYFEDKNTPQYLTYLHVLPEDQVKKYVACADTDQYRRGMELLDRIVADHPNCTKVPISDLYLDGGRVWVLDSHDVLYVDDDHLSYAGSLKAKDRIRQYVEACFDRNR